MSKFKTILRHFGLSKKRTRAIKKLIKRTENEKKTPNAKTHVKIKRVEIAASFRP